MMFSRKMSLSATLCSQIPDHNTKYPFTFPSPMHDNVNTRCTTTAEFTGAPSYVLLRKWRRGGRGGRGVRWRRRLRRGARRRRGGSGWRHGDVRWRGHGSQSSRQVRISVVDVSDIVTPTLMFVEYRLPHSSRCHCLTIMRIPFGTNSSPHQRRMHVPSFVLCAVVELPAVPCSRSLVCPCDSDRARCQSASATLLLRRFGPPSGSGAMYPNLHRIHFPPLPTAMPMDRRHGAHFVGPPPCSTFWMGSVNIRSIFMFPIFLLGNA